MSDLNNTLAMLQRIGMEVTHKHHPRWATADRLIVRAAGTKLCYSFDHQGSLISLSWGEHVDQDLG